MSMESVASHVPGCSVRPQGREYVPPEDCPVCCAEADGDNRAFFAFLNLVGSCWWWQPSWGLG